jgi:hypothetical protein
MTHELTIAGQHLTVRSSADAAYVRSLANLVEERVRRAEQQGATSVHAWMVVALGLADEASRLRTELASLRTTVEGGADELLGILAQATAPLANERGRPLAENCDA